VKVINRPFAPKTAPVPCDSSSDKLRTLQWLLPGLIAMFDPKIADVFFALFGSEWRRRALVAFGYSRRQIELVFRRDADSAPGLDFA